MREACPIQLNPFLLNVCSKDLTLRISYLSLTSKLLKVLPSYFANVMKTLMLKHITFLPLHSEAVILSFMVQLTSLRPCIIDVRNVNECCKDMTDASDW